MSTVDTENLSEELGISPHATIHFDTTRAWEEPKDPKYLREFDIKGIAKRACQGLNTTQHALVVELDDQIEMTRTQREAIVYVIARAVSKFVGADLEKKETIGDIKQQVLDSLNELTTHEDAPGEFDADIKSRLTYVWLKERK